MVNTGCALIVEVEEIIANPSNYEGKKVAILEGATVDSFWLTDLEKGGYRIAGCSGVTIWVVTSRKLPQMYEVVRVRGIVEKTFTLGERLLEPVIIEQSRKLIYHYPLPTD